MMRYLFTIILCSLLLTACSEKGTELTVENSRDSIGYITKIKDGKLYMDMINIETNETKEMYFKNPLLKKSFFVDFSSIINYHLLKGNNETMSLLFDSKKCKLYKIDSERVTILGETANYVYFSIIDDNYINIHQLNKENDTIEFTDKKIKITGKFIITKASSNYDSDEIYCCYSMDGKSYSCKINKNDISIRELLDYPTSNTFCLNESGDRFLSLYNASSSLYTFDPIIISLDNTQSKITAIDNLEEGSIEFSFVYNNTFYMGYLKNLLYLYTWNQNDGLKELEQIENFSNISWTIYNEKLYIYFGENFIIIN
ncbi:hypothetical protein [Herbinix luporum]|uniref:Putative secreted protein n=1 Tax=Herbinix luporum TaxID=1679721 RepID=A0A0K8J789_9FIRM|nr:hypothetical protein [Herbinix luporum]CUH93420.1 putative secreted protein [Herbinix luporum]